jgi:hypothetical protein
MVIGTIPQTSMPRSSCAGDRTKVHFHHIPDSSLEMVQAALQSKDSPEAAAAAAGLHEGGGPFPPWPRP